MSSVSSPSRGVSGSCSTISWPDSVSPERVTLQQAGGGGESYLRKWDKQFEMLI